MPHAIALRALVLLLLLATLTALLPPGVASPAAAAPALQTTEVSGSVEVGSGIHLLPAATPLAQRVDMSATLLNDGRVLLAGGRLLVHQGAWTGYSDPVATAELYDPATGTFSATGSMAQARVGHSATLLADGSVLLIGGGVAGAERYDPASGSFSPTGPLASARPGHSATLLPDGRVLVVGGTTSPSSAGLYDPATNRFSPTGAPKAPRQEHAAALLADGRVLVVGGTASPGSAELYDPASGQFSLTAAPPLALLGPKAAGLPDGRALVVGGHADVDRPALLYDPAANTFSQVGPRVSTAHVQGLLQQSDGTLLIVGGITGESDRYDPASGSFSRGGRLTAGSYGPSYLGGGAVVVLADDSVLSIGRRLIPGQDIPCDDYDPYCSYTELYEVVAARGRWAPANTLSATLALPTGWVTGTNRLALSLRATGSGPPATSARLYANRFTLPTVSRYWGPAVALSNGQTASATTAPLQEGPSVPLTLYVTDSFGREAAVVSGTVKVDTKPPGVTISFADNDSLYGMSPTFGVSWSGQDDQHGVAGYWVDVSPNGGPWAPLLSNTLETSTSFSGKRDRQYCFRVRAADTLGNIHPFNDSPIGCVYIFSDGPPAQLLLNRGARSTITPEVMVGMLNPNERDGSEFFSAPWQYSFDGATWTSGPTDSIFPLGLIMLPEGDGEKVVYARLREDSGAVSAVFSSTIRLDTSAGSDNVVSINAGAQFTNTPAVALRIAVEPRTEQMQISNNPAFSGAEWQPFDTRPSWALSPSGGSVQALRVYVRTQKGGSPSPTLVDDIVYDPLAPTGAVTRVRREGEQVTLELRAQDQSGGSGVGWMRVGLAGQLEAAEWQPYAASAQLTLPAGTPAGQAIVAEFRDRAGNRSMVSCRSLDNQPCLAGFSGSALIPAGLHIAQTGSLVGQRLAPSATLLDDGSVLIAGGSDPEYSFGLSTAELYDPATGTFSATGSMAQARAGHSATLLADGSVLIVGYTADAERYDPATRTFGPAGTLTSARGTLHTATRLLDGRVLIVGGFDSPGTAELYDPATNSFSPTGSPQSPRYSHLAALLNDGRVLIAGGRDRATGDSRATAELYDPASGTFSPAGPMLVGYTSDRAAAATLPDGRVLLTGSHVEPPYSAQLYDPASNTFSATGPLPELVVPRALMRLSDGRLLLAAENTRIKLLALSLYDPASGSFDPVPLSGIYDEYNRPGLSGALRLADDSLLLQDYRTFRGTWHPTNTVSATLDLPTDWITGTNTLTVSLRASASGAQVTSARLSLGDRWTQLIPLTDGETLTTTVVSAEGAQVPVTLYVRDSIGREVAAVTGTVKVDVSAPRMGLRIDAEGRTFSQSPQLDLNWSGEDPNGVAGYWLDMRVDGGPWEPLLADTLSTSLAYTGERGRSYCFRLRAIDLLGNRPYINEIPEECSYILPDPPAALRINGGARSSSAERVYLTFEDPNRPTRRLVDWEYSFDGTSWTPGTYYYYDVHRAVLDLPPGDGEKQVYVRLRDSAGALTPVISGTVRLDTAAGTENKLLLNGGAAYTNSPTVTLTIGATNGAQMQISNEGGFDGAEWQPFDSRPEWLISRYGDYALSRTVYVRVRDIRGRIGPPLNAEIFYDPLAPTGAITRVRREGERVTVELRASDEAGGSGVGWMRVGLAGQLEAAEWRPYAASAQLTLPAGTPNTQAIAAEFRDRAGNRSAASCRSLVNQPCPLLTQLYLPALHR